MVKLFTEILMRIFSKLKWKFHQEKYLVTFIKPFSMIMNLKISKNIKYYFYNFYLNIYNNIFTQSHHHNLKKISIYKTSFFIQFSWIQQTKGLLRFYRKSKFENKLWIWIKKKMLEITIFNLFFKSTEVVIYIRILIKFLTKIVIFDLNS